MGQWEGGLSPPLCFNGQRSEVGTDVRRVGEWSKDGEHLTKPLTGPQSEC